MFEHPFVVPGVLFGLLIAYLLMRFAVNSAEKNELFRVQPCGIKQEPHPEENFPEEAISTNKKSTVDDFERLMI